MDDYSLQPMEFKFCNYNYRVTFGETADADSIAWEYIVIFRDWKTAQAFIDMYHECTNHAAIKIDMEYNKP